MNSYKELVVVLSFFSVFSVVTILALSRNPDTWKEEVCAKNLSEIYRMACMYADANDGVTMPVVIKSLPLWKFWSSFIMRYTDNPAFFYCPANRKAAEFFERRRDPLEPVIFDPFAQSYGVNYQCPDDGGLKVSDVINSSSVIYFGDSRTPYLRATEHCWMRDYAPRHELKSNFIFMDGHVEKMNHENLGLCQAFGDWKKDIERWKPQLKQEEIK